MDYTAIGLTRVPELLPVVDVTLDCDYCEVADTLSFWEVGATKPIRVDAVTGSIDIAMPNDHGNGAKVSFMPGTTGVCVFDPPQLKCEPDYSNPCKGVFTFDFYMESGKYMRYSVADPDGIVADGYAYHNGPQVVYLAALCGNTHSYSILLEVYDEETFMIHDLVVMTVTMRCSDCAPVDD